MKIEVNPNLPITKMSAGVTEGPGSLRSLQSLLKLDSFYEGTVLDLLPGRGIVLRLAGETITAQTDVVLAKGTTATFQVRAVDPQIVLKVIAEKPAEAWPKEAFRQLITLRNDTAKILEAVTEQLSQARCDAGQEHPEGLTHLTRLWDKVLLPRPSMEQVLKSIGLNWEGKLAQSLLKGETSDFAQLIRSDLKALATEVLQNLSAQESGDGLTRALSSLLNLVEGYQSANLLLASTGETGIFFPVWFSEGSGWGECELLLGKDRGGKEGNKEGKGAPYSVLFFLNMSQLGPMRISLQVMDKNVNCQFAVDSKGKQEYVEALLPELRERVSSSGFAILSMECVSKGKEEIEDVSSWFEILSDFRQPLLHVVI